MYHQNRSQLFVYHSMWMKVLPDYKHLDTHHIVGFWFDPETMSMCGMNIPDSLLRRCGKSCHPCHPYHMYCICSLILQFTCDKGSVQISVSIISDPGDSRYKGNDVFYYSLSLQLHRERESLKPQHLHCCSLLYNLIYTYRMVDPDLK